MASQQPEPFEFLRLPKELRVMVYESIDIHTQHHKIYGAPVVWNREPVQASATLVVKGLSIQLLATCRLIYEEAKPILIPKVKLLREITPRVMVESGATHALKYVMDDCRSWMRAVIKYGDRAEFKKRFGTRTAGATEHDDARSKMDDDMEGKRMFIRKTGIAFAWQARHLRIARPNEWVWNTKYPYGSRKNNVGKIYLGIRLTVSPWERDLSPIPPDRSHEDTVFHRLEDFIQLNRSNMKVIEYWPRGQNSYAKIVIGWELPNMAERNIRTLERTYWGEFQLERGWDIGEHVGECEDDDINVDPGIRE